MTLTDDDWVKAFSPIEAEKLHALGVISFMWNACEYKLFELFQLIMGITPQVAWLLVHDLGDVSIINRINAFLESFVPDPIKIQLEKELIEHALKAYDICRQNRNQFTHFTLEHDLDSLKVTLLRQEKGPLLRRVPFPNDLSDMRRVAHELMGMNTYLHNINSHIMNRGTDQAVPLPDKVVLPELLLKPLLPTDTAGLPLRAPSVLKLTEEDWIAKYRKEGKPLPGGSG